MTRSIQSVLFFRGRATSAVAFALALGAAALILGGCADDADGNRPPVFEQTDPEVRGRVGDTIERTFAAKDPDGDEVNIIAQKKPEGSEFIFSSFGRFAWSPLADDAGGDHELILVADDGRGGRATLRVVFVIEASNGAPRFTTSAQRVLDMTRTECLDTIVEVQDDDSSEVGLQVEAAPEGMILTKIDGKRGKLEWCPSQEQVNKQKKVFGATIVADDGSGSLVTQAFTVILITKNACSEDSGECGCNPPTLQHSEIGDQRSASDYEIVATIADAESSVVKPTIAFAINPADPDATGDYENIPMELLAGDQYKASIRNPLLNAGQTADIFYFICAFDDDDPSGDTCDNFACTPGTGVFHFVAYPAGDESCRADDFEPNETFSAAASPGDEETYGLSICDGDVDVFAYPLEADGSFSALIAFDPAQGELEATLLSVDGATEVGDVALDDVGIFVDLDVVPTTGTYFLEVRGPRNGYDLFTQSVGSSADCDDADEPNDDFGTATPAGDGTRSGLSICTADRDFYALELVPGDNVQVLVTFPHSAGDIDIQLHRAEGGAEVRADSSTDDEFLEYVARQAGTYYVEIYGFGDATNVYDMAISITAGTIDPCDPDASEPANNSPGGAAVQQGSHTLTGYGICPDDEDFFGVDMLFGERIKATLEIAEPNQDLDLALVDTNMSTILEISDGFTTTEVIYYTASFSGAYFLYVYGDAADASPYTLDVESCLNDGAEPNDTRATAHGTSPGTNTQWLCLGEADWYSVPMQAGQAILVEATPQSSADVAKMELSFYGPDGGDTPLESGRADAGTISLLRDAPTAGTYLIRVKSLDPDLSFLYDLAIEVD